MSDNGQHHYSVNLSWTGAAKGFASYESYDRTHLLRAPGKPLLTASSDPAFVGTAELWNPEDMLVASLSSCHMLSYLACCSRARIEVIDYSDDASGIMVENGKGGGNFTEVTLRPRVVIADPEKLDHARKLHGTASKVCFIANSMNFPVHHDAEVTVR